VKKFLFNFSRQVDLYSEFAYFHYHLEKLNLQVLFLNGYILYEYIKLPLFDIVFGICRKDIIIFNPIAFLVYIIYNI